MNRFKQFILKPEYIGFVIGALCTFVAFEMTGTYRALLIALLTFCGLELAHQLARKS